MHSVKVVCAVSNSPSPFLFDEDINLDASRLHEMLSDDSEASCRGSVTTHTTEETTVDRPDVLNYDF